MDWPIFGSCLAGFFAVSTLIVAFRKCWRTRIAHSPICSKSLSPDRMSRYSSVVSSPKHFVNRHANSPQKRQRRDSASPGGGVVNKFGALNLGRSDCEIRQRASGLNWSNTTPSKYQHASTPSFLSAYNGTSSSCMERSILWPSRFSPTGQTTVLQNGDNDDAVSIFTSVSQRAYERPNIKNVNQPIQTSQSMDWTWKMVVCLVMLGNFTTNAAVLYYLLTRG